MARVTPGRRSRVAVLGGTFDHLHSGHHALLAAAFQRAREVKIGLTSDKFVRKERKPLVGLVQSYETRRRSLRKFLRLRFGRRRWSIVALNDRWGSVRPGADLLVLSEETRRAARSINAERRRRGLAPLRVCVVQQVRGEDGRPIASRRIRAGEIDRDGHLLRTWAARTRATSTKS